MLYVFVQLLCYDNDYEEAMTFNPAKHHTGVDFVLLLDPACGVDNNMSLLACGVDYSLEAGHVFFR